MSNPPTGATVNARDNDAANPAISAVMALNTRNNPYLLVNHKRFILPYQRQSSGFKTAAAYLNADENDNSNHTVMQATKMKNLVIATAETHKKSGMNAPVIDTSLETKMRGIEGFGEGTIHNDRYSMPSLYL